jgi:FAS-associated factor 2
MTIDDSEQGDTPSSSLSRRAPGRGVAPAYPSGASPKSWSLISILSFPFSLLGGIIGFIFRLLRFPFGGTTFRPGGSGSIGGLGLGLTGRGIVEDPATVAERFVRELEDETGALTVSYASGASTEEKAGSLNAGKAREDRKLLPDMFIGSYDQALKAAETELKVLCAIVLSSEHDDVPEFRRYTAFFVSITVSELRRLTQGPL